MLSHQTLKEMLLFAACRVAWPVFWTFLLSLVDALDNYCAVTYIMVRVVGFVLLVAGLTFSIHMALCLPEAYMDAFTFARERSRGTYLYFIADNPWWAASPKNVRMGV